MILSRLIPMAFTVAVSLVAVSLNAATLEKLGMEEMAVKSTEIVLGRVSSTRYVQRGSVVYTVASVEVEERWKGKEAGRVDVWVAGGTVGGIKQIYPGSPELRQGYQYLFFLWTGRSGIAQVIGLSQGLFDVKPATGEAKLQRSASTETMLDKTGQRITDQPVDVSLSQMRELVRRAIGKERE